MADQQLAGERPRSPTLGATRHEPLDPTEPMRSFWSLLDDTQEALAEACEIVDELAYESKANRYGSSATAVAFQKLDAAAENVRLAANLARVSQTASDPDAVATFGSSG